MSSNLNTLQTEHARQVRMGRKVRRDPDLRRLHADKLAIEAEVLDLRRRLCAAQAEIAQLRAGTVADPAPAAESSDMFAGEQATGSTKRKTR